MSSTTPRDGLLDIDGLADRLGVGERFVRRLVEEWRIPYLKIGQSSSIVTAGFVDDDLTRGAH